MRGNRILFNALLIDNPRTTINKKGRSNKLIDSRNEVLLYRYYFYIKLKHMQYNNTLERISFELFLSPRTVIDILQKNVITIKHIISTAPDIKELSEKFDFLNWK